MEGRSLRGQNHNLSSMKGKTVNVNVSEFVANLRTWNDAENVGSYVLKGLHDQQDYPLTS